MRATARRGCGGVEAKAVVDGAVAAIALLLLSPLLAAVALAVRLSLGRPVLFRQLRPGLQERLFTLYKFRTMRREVDGQGRPLPDGTRLTGLGRLLRRASLDELPQLFNVLKGDMSLVGPRPLLPEYLPLYTPRQARRHEVRPGMTGWAQVNGRNALSWEDKFELDTWYVENRSWRLDLEILARTVLHVLRPAHINQPGQATAQPFLGSPAATAALPTRAAGAKAPAIAPPARPTGTAAPPSAQPQPLPHP